jgi:uncharacterized protein involved in exopolysaccharide biosynthesis
MASNNNITSSSILNDQFDFSLFLFIAKKNLIFIALFFLVVFFSGYLYVRYETEIFDASSVIQIIAKNEANDILETATNNNEKILAGDVEYIRSRAFMNKALKQLPLEVSYFYKGTFKTNEHYKNSLYEAEVLVKNQAIIEIFDK